MKMTHLLNCSVLSGIRAACSGLFSISNSLSEQLLSSFVQPETPAWYAGPPWAQLTDGKGVARQKQASRKPTAAAKTGNHGEKKK